jgi:hypothetical protein
VDGGQPEHAAHRAAQRLPPERIRRLAGDDVAGGAGRFGDAGDGADVAGILHVDGDDDERRRPAGPAITASSACFGRAATATTPDG